MPDEAKIPKEEIERIRQNILAQVKNFPPDKADELREQIEAMPDDEFVDFLRKNNMTQQGESQEQQCIFCLISEGKVESSSVYEDSEIIAVLDINPLSKGHTLIIPREHISKTENLKASTFEKARMLSSLIKKELNADSIEILTSSRLGHAIINIIPVYNNAPLLDFKRQKTPKESIKEIAGKLAVALKDNEQKEEENKAMEQKAKASEEVKNIRIKRRRP
ncbi:HIT family protein [Candidatus Pacearchaeota archaeon]|nr:HIT family protein [Candidatus Pacearchaeota archaeon]